MGNLVFQTPYTRLGCLKSNISPATNESRICRIVFNLFVRGTLLEEEKIHAIHGNFHGLKQGGMNEHANLRSMDVR